MQKIHQKPLTRATPKNKLVGQYSGSLKVLLFTGAWLSGYYFLARYGVLILPSAVAQKLTLSSYLGIVQLLVTGIGVTGIHFLTLREPELRKALLPLKVRPHAIAYALLLAPALYVVAHSLGMYLAFDTLIAELARHGSRAVQQQTGEFGRSTALDSWMVVVPFTVVIAPLGEELLFRGGIYGAVQALWSKLSARSSSSHAPPSPIVEETPDSLVIAGLPRKRSPLFPQFMSLIKNGGGAVIFSSLVFGFMHADTPGGMGIVRLTSASVLGLACGIARLKGASLITAITLHAGYNLLALGTLRLWFTSESWPSKYALPTIFIPIAGFEILAAGVLLFTQKRSASRAKHA